MEINTAIRGSERNLMGVWQDVRAVIDRLRLDGPVDRDSTVFIFSFTFGFCVTARALLDFSKDLKKAGLVLVLSHAFILSGETKLH